MVFQRHASSKSRTLRVCGFVAAYAFALATGTAVLIAAFGSFDDARLDGRDGSTLTPAEIVMQQTAERGLPQPEALLLASRNLPNDKRGF